MGLVKSQLLNNDLEMKVCGCAVIDPLRPLAIPHLC